MLTNLPDLVENSWRQYLYLNLTLPRNHVQHSEKCLVKARLSTLQNCRAGIGKSFREKGMEKHINDELYLTLVAEAERYSPYEVERAILSTGVLNYL